MHIKWSDMSEKKYFECIKEESEDWSFMVIRSVSMHVS